MMKYFRDESRKLGWPRITALLICCSFLIFHCVTVLAFLVRSGPLSIVALYDDVSYLNDGLRRLPLFERDGLLGIVRSFLASPPHAPFSSTFAIIGFAVTPSSRIGAYALDCLWVLMFFALMSLALRGTPLLNRLGILTASLSVPLMSIVIGAFRPDPAWGLITGAVAVILATLDFRRASLLHMLISGMLAGAALLTKPTGMLPGTAVLSVAILGSAITASWSSDLRLRDAAVKLFTFILGAAIVVGPYLLVAWRPLWTYVFNAMVTNSAVWRVNGSFIFHLIFYIRPDFALPILGWLLYVGPLLLTIYVGLALYGGQKLLIGQTLTITAVLATSFAIPTASPVKTAFIGCLFYGCFFSVSLWSAGRLSSRLNGPIVFAMGILMLVIFWHPDQPFLEPPDIYKTVNKVTEAITPQILHIISEANNDGLEPTVYESVPGPVITGSIEFAALMNGLRGSFLGDYTDPSWEKILQNARSSDIVLTTAVDGSDPTVGFNFPGTKYQNLLVQTLSSDPKWRQLIAYTRPDAPTMFVFIRRAAFSGVRLSFGSGFLPEEGPYPNAKLPKFHWMVGNTGKITATSEGFRPQNFNLKCESIADITIHVADSTGRLLASKLIHAREESGQFDSVPVLLGKDTPLSISTIPQPNNVPHAGWPGLLLCASSASIDP